MNILSYPFDSITDNWVSYKTDLVLYKWHRQMIPYYENNIVQKFDIVIIFQIKGIKEPIEKNGEF